MNKAENQLSDMLLNKELTPDEKDKRAVSISNYLLGIGGVITAVSCQDGILLAGVNPDDKKTIFKVFHRIGLLGMGKIGSVKSIHKEALPLAVSMGLMLSKSDIKVQDITSEIAAKIEKNFNYLKSKEGPYKANFIIAELGFEIEKDILNFVDFTGEEISKRKLPDSGYPICINEIPMFEDFDMLIELPVLDENGNIKKGKDEKPEIENKKVVKGRNFRWPITKGLSSIINSISPGDDDVLSVKEAALFVGAAFRLLDERGGRLEMAYLDREMLKKSKTEKRRFHHIWQWITNPDPDKNLDPWNDWEKFVAPVYKKVKKGELYPKQKSLIDLYEIFGKNKFDPKEKELIEKIQKEEMLKLMKDLLEKK